MKEKQGNQKKNENTLNLMAIFEALQKTEHKINELQRYSSRDFSMLNQKFLSFHKKNSNLFSRVKELSHEIDGLVHGQTKNNLSLEEIKSITSLLKKTNKEFESLKGKILTENETIDYILIPLNNYKQNLITLKFLSANLKIDNNARGNETEFNQLTQNIIPVLENICLFFPKIQKYAEEYKSSNNATIKNINEFQDKFYNVALKEIDSIWDIRLNYVERINKNNRLVQEIKDHKVQNKQNVDSIITNLQYQDIIRQRIEHIYETHQELINDLKGFFKKEDENELNIFRKIKDIVGLQSAQLIHINQEFQSAIENISEKIKDYNHEISKYTDHLSLFVKKVGIQEAMARDNIIASGDFKIRISSIHAFINVVSDIRLTRDKKSGEFKKYLFEVFDINGKIKKIKSFINAEGPSGTIKNILAILNENIELCDRIEKYIVDIEIKSKNVASDQVLLLANMNEIIELYESFEKSLIFINLYKMSDGLNTIHNLINETIGDQKSINKALHELEYYQFFEHNVNEIIDHLNNVNEKIEIFVESNNIKLAENIEHVKKRYTTENEHNVHKQFSLAGISGKKNEKTVANRLSHESDDVEFF